MKTDLGRGGGGGVHKPATEHNLYMIEEAKANCHEKTSYSCNMVVLALGITVIVIKSFMYLPTNLLIPILCIHKRK